MTADDDRQIRPDRVVSHRDRHEIATWKSPPEPSCLRWQGGAWTIVHEHALVPFDADTGYAVLRGEL